MEPLQLYVLTVRTQVKGQAEPAIRTYGSPDPELLDRVGQHLVATKPVEAERVLYTVTLLETPA